MDESVASETSQDTGQEPMETESSTEQSNIQDSVETSNEEAGGTKAPEEEDMVDLKKMSEDYAQYLVVNSKQDVSSCVYVCMV